jgi:hypothetical protein
MMKNKPLMVSMIVLGMKVIVSGVADIMLLLSYPLNLNILDLT